MTRDPDPYTRQHAPDRWGMALAITVILAFATLSALGIIVGLLQYIGCTPANFYLFS